MSMGQGGQGVPGGTGGAIDEARRRMQSGDRPRPQQATGPGVAQGGQYPAPPSAPTQTQAPVQPGGGTSVGLPGAQGVGVPLGGGMTVTNPYQPQGGQGPKSQQGDDVWRGGQTAVSQATPVSTKPSMPAGMPIGPTPGKATPDLDMGAVSAAQLKPTPNNPSPNGPSRLGGGAQINPAIGGAPAGGFQKPSFGNPQSGSAGRSNLPGRNVTMRNDLPQVERPVNPYSPPPPQAKPGPEMPIPQTPDPNLAQTGKPAGGIWGNGPQPEWAQGTAGPARPTWDRRPIGPGNDRNDRNGGWSPGAGNGSGYGNWGGGAGGGASI